jgi:hypothetical protein
VVALGITTATRISLAGAAPAAAVEPAGAAVGATAGAPQALSSSETTIITEKTNINLFFISFLLTLE